MGRCCFINIWKVCTALYKDKIFNGLPRGGEGGGGGGGMKGEPFSPLHCEWF